MTRADVLVVGAGLGGLAFAQDATRAGLRVALLDKARGVSGRAATRRVTLPDGPEVRLDHGARFFTARSDRTRTLAEGGVRDGWNAVWTCGVARWQAGQVTAPDDGHPRYAPPAGMSALGRTLARGLDVKTGVAVTSLERLNATQGGGWRVHSREGQYWDGARLILNVPAPQLLALLATLDPGSPDPVPAILHGHDSEAAARQAGLVTYDPCWAAGVILRHDVPADWRALRPDHPVLEWIAREHTKRPDGAPPALTLHATPAWTRANLERTPEQVLPDLLAAAQDILGPLDTAQAFAHRWRYSIPAVTAPGPCHWDAALGLGCCGDWFTPDPHGPRVESALLSGWALARRVTGTD